LVSFQPPPPLSLSHLDSQDCKNRKKQFLNLNNYIDHTPSHSLPLFLHIFPNRSSPLSLPRRLVTQIFLNDLLLKSSHSVLFNSLKSCDFDLDFKLVDDSKLALQRYGQYLYDNLILFSPSIKSKLLNPNKLLFVVIKLWFL